MTITIPEEFKDTLWGRKLYISRKNNNSFIVFTQKEKDILDEKFSVLDKNPDNVAFNRFILANIIETKSVNDLLELPETFEDFSKGNVSFSLESNSVLVSKV